MLKPLTSRLYCSWLLRVHYKSIVWKEVSKVINVVIKSIFCIFLYHRYVWKRELWSLKKTYVIFVWVGRAFTCISPWHILSFCISGFNYFGTLSSKPLSGFNLSLLVVVYTFFLPIKGNINFLKCHTFKK